MENVRWNAMFRQSIIAKLEARLKAILKAFQVPCSR